MKFALLALVVLPTMTASEGVSSKLQVEIPHDMSQPGGFDHREALFGVPPYGGSIQQQVYYADSDLCDPNVDTHSGYPTRKKDSEGKMEAWPSPYILMVDRGGCTFVNKVRNAQRSGAAGVIIADTSCLCSADNCVDETPGAICENREPIMADDGSGSDISIPSFLMFKQDADPIKATLMRDTMVRMSMSWSLPNPDARVEYELWTTPTDMVSRDFQRQFKEAAIALGPHAYFTPHMYVYDGLKSGCQDSEGQNQCYDLCSNNGRYCATDPDGMDIGIAGQDVVRESLRRECIWAIHGSSDGIGTQWWDYVNEFMLRCDNEEFFKNDGCAADCMARAGIDQGTVLQCMNESGGLTEDQSNTVLENILASKDASGVVILPAAYVNGAAIRGALEFATIFKAICAGYQSGSEPLVCQECSGCTDEFQCVLQGQCPGADGSGGISLPVFAGSLGGLALFFIFVACCQYVRAQQQMRDQVKGIMAEYMPVEEMNKNMGEEGTGVGLEDGEFS